MVNADLIPVAHCVAKVTNAEVRCRQGGLTRAARENRVSSRRRRQDNSATPCACRKLHPAILMMKSAEDRLSSELAEPLDRPTARRILAQGQMRSEFVVVAGVGRKDPAQMGLAEDDDVIEAFPADRADQSLRMPVLPG